MKYFLFLILLILFVANLIPSFAQFGTNVSVNTNKLSYIDGDTIVISGNVKAILSGTPILIQIFDPVSNRIEVAQKDVAQDGSFIHTIKATGPLWGKYGEYTVKVSFGPVNTVETIFSFGPKEVMSETKKIFEVDAGSYGTFDIPYIIREGSIEDITIDKESLALIVSLNSPSDGTLSLDIPRKLTDAKHSDGNDISFIVLVDGIEVSYQETTTSTSRTLTVQFIKGDSEIEIIGTYIIPEFSSIATMILSVGILFVIVVSASRILKLYQNSDII